MKHRLLTITAITLLSLSSSVQAGTTKGELIDDCRVLEKYLSDIRKAPLSDLVKIVSCERYIRGVWHGIDIVSVISKKPRLCYPKQVRKNRWPQTVIIPYLRHAEANPQTFGKPAGIGLTWWLLDKFMCR